MLNPVYTEPAPMTSTQPAQQPPSAYALFCQASRASKIARRNADQMMGSAFRKAVGDEECERRRAEAAAECEKASAAYQVAFDNYFVHGPGKSLDYFGRHTILMTLSCEEVA